MQQDIEKRKTGGKCIMRKKEHLISEIEDLVALLNWCLRTLRKGEIDEAAYQQLNISIESLQWALRYYFCESSTDSSRITILDPDVWGMKFE